jgi:hypothetical protein
MIDNKSLASRQSMRDNEREFGSTYIVHELGTNRSNILAQSSREHHDLLAVWSSTENLLNITTHI